MNVGKSKVMVFQRSKSEMIKFACSYRVKVECLKQCNIKLNGERMQVLNKFKYFSLILCKHWKVRLEKVLGSLEHIMKVRTVDVEVKKRLSDGIIVLTIAYSWTWNKSQRFRI